LLILARALAAGLAAAQAYVAVHKHDLDYGHEETPAGIIENQLNPRGDM
jgi:hypothetical protein